MLRKSHTETHTETRTHAQCSSQTSPHALSSINGNLVPLHQPAGRATLLDIPQREGEEKWVTRRWRRCAFDQNGVEPNFQDLEQHGGSVQKDRRERWRWLRRKVVTEEERRAPMENPNSKREENVGIVCPAWGTVRHGEPSEQSVPCVCEERRAGKLCWTERENWRSTDVQRATTRSRTWRRLWFTTN